MKKVLISVVSYNAEDFIHVVLDRIPDDVWNSRAFDLEVLIIDDESTDQTFYKAADFAQRNRELTITTLYNPKNQGYGGNQKIGYHYAIENHFDVVVLLHGDGQYPPECLGQMLTPILKGEAEAVLGSRMVHKLNALKGGMPLYKWVGNQILTFIQNRILSANLSEFHTGYRAYSVPALASIPFQYNSDYFDFDTDIIIQLLDTGRRVKEISIPTFYGDEISRVNGIKYAVLVIRSSLLSRVTRWGIFYDPKFDYGTSETPYTPKLGYASSHQFALERAHPGSTVLDLGCGPGFMARELEQRQVTVISVDRHIHPDVKKHSVRTVEADLDEYDFTSDSSKVDTVLALDVIEHLRSPEGFLQKLRDRYSRDAPEVIITTGNIAFLPLRLGLLFGQFNYGKRGILDLDHTRLFTFYSLRRLLIHYGYDVLEEMGIPAPFPLALGDNRLSRLLLRINSLLIRISKSLFSYQIALVTKPRPTLNHLLQNAREESERKLCRQP
ncbi:MAG: glycosyltransferase [Anaerolineae bacterium]|nr:glycosyltransferase [Anaerolineae bacterium]